MLEELDGREAPVPDLQEGAAATYLIPYVIRLIFV
jgi:hypothetical protein